MTRRIPLSEGVLAERPDCSLSLRSIYRARFCPEAIVCLFFIHNRSLRVIKLRKRSFRRGYYTKRYRFSFEEVESIGLGTWVDPENLSPANPWFFVLRPSSGGYLYLSYGSANYSGSNAAVARICEVTGITRGDPL